MIDDKETADRIVDGLRDAYPQYVKAAIVEALQRARREASQPVAYEVPGFHLTYPTWEDAINGRD